MSRTLGEIINDAIRSISAKRPDLSAVNRSGSVIRDVVVETPAEEFVNVYNDQDKIKKLQSVEFADELTTEELDNLAGNYDLTRRAGTPSTGLVTFTVRDFGSPADGYQDIEISAGSQVSAPATSSRERVTFVTTETVIMYASRYGSYFNPSTGFYEIQAPIEAVVSGVNTNVGPGTIVEILSGPNQVTDVVNLSSTTGGTDPETNEELAVRIKNKLKGNSIGTKAGYVNTVEDVVGVLDSIIIGPNDVEMERTQFGGAVDILIVGEVLKTQTDEFVYVGQEEFLFTNQPVHEIVGVTAIPLGDTEPRPLDESEYELIEDTGIYKRTYKAQNKLKILIALENESLVEPTFIYNDLIIQLQNEIDKDENHIIASDILIREAKELTLNVSFDIEIFSGYALSEVITTVKSYIITQVSGTTLGSRVDKSDIVGWTYAASDGVDVVDLNSVTFILDGEEVETAQASKTEYIRIGEILINGR